MKFEEQNEDQDVIVILGSKKRLEDINGNRGEGKGYRFGCVF